MDIVSAAPAGAAVAPWLVLGIVLGVGVVVLTGLATALVLHRRAPRTAAVEPAGLREDDLPGFLESPPGSTSPTAPAGWAALAPAPAAAEPARRPRRDTLVVLAAMAAAALLLLGTAAAVAASGGRNGHEGAAAPSSARAGTLTARLTFGGVVFEPRAVGVTVTYPVVEVRTVGERARARVEFPTFNCLGAAAPADPVAAGCTPTMTEYAELTSPDLVVAGDVEADGGLRLTGRFPTEVHPNGSPPAPTGRVYELRMTVAAADGAAEQGWRPAEGVLELGPGRTETVPEPGVSVLRSGS